MFCDSPTHGDAEENATNSPGVSDSEASSSSQTESNVELPTVTRTWRN